MTYIKDLEDLIKEARKMYVLDLENYRYEKENHEDTSGTVKHFNGLSLAMNEAYDILMKGIEGTYFEKHNN